MSWGRAPDRCCAPARRRPVETVYATTGDHDPARPTDGAYSVLMKFASGVVANLTLPAMRISIPTNLPAGEQNRAAKDPESYGAARRALAAAKDPTAEAAKSWTAYGGPNG